MWSWKLMFGLWAITLHWGSAAAKLVEYDWNVTYTNIDIDGRGPVLVVAVNGQFPGPLINVTYMDRLKINLHNQLAAEGVSIHFHGFEMRGDAYKYDGAVWVTQCAVPPGEKFTIDFIVDEMPGTYIYHDHAEAINVGVLGLGGPIVVNAREESWEDEDPYHKGHYDRDHILGMYDHYSEPLHHLITLHHGGLMQPASQSYQKNNIGLIPFQSAGINHHAQFGALRLLRTDVASLTRLHRVKISPGERIRLRLLNTATLYSFRFSIDEHDLQVIAVDGGPVYPYDCHAVVLGSGERYDVIITGREDGKSAWIRTETLEDGATDGLPFNGALAVLDYSPGLNATPSSYREPKETALTINCVDLMPVGDYCRPLTDLKRRVPNHFKHHFPTPPSEADMNQRFEISGRATSGGYPAHFVRVTDLKNGQNEHGENQWEGDWVQHHHPKLPVSLFSSEEADHPHTVSITLEQDGWVEIVLNQFDRTQHPWHMHGHKFYVMGIGYPDYTKDCNILRCITPWYGMDRDESHLIDPENAVLKDTVTIPAGGWVVIRFRTDNPGIWLFHCHMLYHLDDGMAIFMHEKGRGKPEIQLSEFPEPWMCQKEMEAAGRLTSGSTDVAKYFSRPEVACNCWYDDTTVFHTTPLKTYRCSHHYLCLHTEQTLDPPGSIGREVRGIRNRADGFVFRIIFAVMWLCVFTGLYLFRRYRKMRQESGGSKPGKQKIPEISGFSIIPGAPTPASSQIGGLGRASVAGSLWNQLQGAADMGLAMTSLDKFRAKRGSFGAKRKSMSARAETMAMHRTLICDWKNDMNLVWANLTVQPVVQGKWWERNKEPEFKMPTLDRVSGVMKPGELLAVIGPPQSGKSLLLNVLAGRRLKNAEVTDGTVLFGGEPLESYTSVSIRALTALLTSDVLLPTGLTVVEVLKLYAVLQKPDEVPDAIVDDYIQVALKQVGMGVMGNKQIGSLSTAEKRRVALCSELLFPRPVILLDEPLAGLDTNSMFTMILWIKEVLQETGSIVIMTVANPPTRLLPKFDKMAIMQKGGTCAYFGPMNKAEDFFASQGCNIPPQWSPTDWYLDCLELGKIICGPKIHWGSLDGQEMSKCHQWIDIEDMSQTSSDGSANESDESSSDRDEPDYDSTENHGDEEEDALNRRGSNVSVPGRRKSSSVAPAPVASSKRDSTTSVTSMHSNAGRNDLNSRRRSSNMSILSNATGKSLKSSASKLLFGGKRRNSAGSVKSLSSVKSTASMKSMRSEKSVALSIGGKKDIKVKSKMDISDRIVRTNTDDDDDPLFNLENGLDGDNLSPGTMSPNSEPQSVSLPQKLLRAASAGSLGGRLSPKKKKRRKKKKGSVGVIKFKMVRRPFWYQVWLLTITELKGGLEAVINIFKFVEVFGLAMVAGIVWFRRGSLDDVVSLGETVGLFFFTTACWSIPPVFATLTTVPALMTRVRVETGRALYDLSALVIARTIGDFLFFAIWPAMWLSVAYTMADIGASAAHFLMMQLLLITHVLAMQSFALTIGVILVNPLLTVIVGNVFAQFMLATNGFYTVLPKFMAPFSVISIPRYTFRALLKLEYSFRDSFQVGPTKGASYRGYPTTWVPAEMTSTFENMRRRDLGIMDDGVHHSQDVDIIFEMTVLVCVVLAGRVVLWFFLRRFLKGMEAKRFMRRDPDAIEDNF